MGPTARRVPPLLRHRVATIALALLVTGCATVVPPSRQLPRPAPAPVPAPTTPAPQPAPRPEENAVITGVAPGPAIDSLLPAEPERLGAALRAFRASCPSLLRRTDQSGLTMGSDWQPACAAASSWSDSQAREFFRRYFEAVRVGEGAAFVTGYYEPEIAGCRQPTSHCAVPLYRRPADLIDVDLGLFSDSLKSRSIRGKVDGTKLVPYDERARITAGSLAGRDLELAYAEDPVELFFLEVQGSGRLRLPDGNVMRVGYAGQNGRDYTGIGRLMKERGLVRNGSMQEIMAWLRANPAEGQAIMNENRSYVFFRELTGDGPVGALGIAVTPRATVAADPRFVPLGAPVILSLDRAEANGLWIAQDTGGAIKGANRFDSFWGAGADARRIAGGMSGRGSAWLLLPIGTQARVSQNDKTPAQP